MKQSKNFLAIDTSSGYFTAVAVKDGKKYVSFLPDCAMRHSVLLPGEIDKLSERANLSLEDCDFFAVVVGAGSFTGLRIGISTIKAFCFAYHKPALPVTSFEVAAYNAVYGGRENGETEKAEKILAIVNALHDQYYACGFDGEGNIILPPCFLTEADVLLLHKQGYALYAPEKVPLEGKGVKVTVADPALGLYIAASRLGADEKNFKEPTALYIRKSQAELNAKL